MTEEADQRTDDQKIIALRNLAASREEEIERGGFTVVSPGSARSHVLGKARTYKNQVS
jgi:hypothetical protein